MTCSCPDWAKPCKHLAAVLLLLGEEIAHRPLALLSLRGIEPDDIFPPETPLGTLSSLESLEPLTPLDPLPSAGDALAVLRRLGPVPFWRGINPCQETLEKMLSRQQAVARNAAAGESVDLRT